MDPEADAPTRTRLRDRIWLSEVLAAPFARVYEHDDPNPRLDDVTCKDSPFWTVRHLVYSSDIIVVTNV